MNVVMEFFENEKNTKIKENEKKITEMTTKLSGLEQQEEKLKTELEKIQNEIKNIKDDKKTMEKPKENLENNQDPQKGEENEVKKLLKGVRLNKENKDEKKEERDISISKILDSMESFPKTISIQKNGCFLLNFYSNQEDKIKEIGEKGIDRILTAIKESEKNNEIYDPGLEALVKIFTKDPNLDQKKRTELIDFCAKTLSPEEQNTTQVAILKLFEIFKVSKEEAGKLDLKNKVNEIQKQNDKDKDIKKLTKEILKNWD
ncbi:protein aardvark [Anaeramoeba ignava]|uniref:Protein aardvark n=1 Tax=Anaeramoeba ignava TaxID=1746090 RepID=A0A9Q0R969_ANAIG|nr:protein aardvark [Anaeramoeba ignava]